MSKNLVNDPPSKPVPISDPHPMVAPTARVLVETETLPEHVIKNVEAIEHHQIQHQQNTKTHHRILSKIGAVFGSPKFLYGQIIFYAIWIGSSHLAEQKIIPKNFPLFNPEIHLLEIASLLISTEVLVYQTREEKIRAEQSHLMLQLNLVTEQKIAKLIGLVEELRVDLPDVIDRDDLEAEIMQQAIDPQAILEAIQQNSLVDKSPSPPELHPQQTS